MTPSATWMDGLADADTQAVSETPATALAIAEQPMPSVHPAPLRRDPGERFRRDAAALLSDADLALLSRTAIGAAVGVILAHVWCGGIALTFSVPGAWWARGAVLVLVAAAFGLSYAWLGWWMAMARVTTQLGLRQGMLQSLTRELLAAIEAELRRAPDGSEAAGERSTHVPLTTWQRALDRVVTRHLARVRGGEHPTYLPDGLLGRMNLALTRQLHRGLREIGVTRGVGSPARLALEPLVSAAEQALPQIVQRRVIRSARLVAALVGAATAAAMVLPVLVALVR